MVSSTCPACASTALEGFYEVASVPVHSCLMMDNRADAAAVARDDLRLAIRAEDVSSVRILDTRTSAVNVTLRSGPELNLVAPEDKVGRIYGKIKEAL